MPTSSWVHKLRLQIGSVPHTQEPWKVQVKHEACTSSVCKMTPTNGKPACSFVLQFTAAWHITANAWAPPQCIGGSTIHRKICNRFCCGICIGNYPLCVYLAKELPLCLRGHVLLKTQCMSLLSCPQCRFALVFYTRTQKIHHIWTLILRIKNTTLDNKIFFVIYFLYICFFYVCFFLSK